MPGCQEFPPPTSCLEHFRTIFLQPCSCLWKGQAHLSDSRQGTWVQEWSRQPSQRLFQENWTEPCASLSPGLAMPKAASGTPLILRQQARTNPAEAAKVPSAPGFSCSGSSALNCRCRLWKPGCRGCMLAACGGCLGWGNWELEGFLFCF